MFKLHFRLIVQKRKASVVSLKKKKDCLENVNLVEEDFREVLLMFMKMKMIAQRKRILNMYWNNSVKVNSISNMKISNMSNRNEFVNQILRIWSYSIIFSNRRLHILYIKIWSSMYTLFLYCFTYGILKLLKLKLWSRSKIS